MPLLPLVVALNAAGTVVSLLLVFALIRRVRAMSADGAGANLPAAGHVVGPFTVRTLDGVELTRADAADALVVFLSPMCAPCRQVAADLAETAAHVLVFVAGPADDPNTVAFARQFERHVVAIVPDEGAVTDAFDVTAFPSVLAVRDGIVAVAGHRLGAVAGTGQTAHV